MRDRLRDRPGGATIECKRRDTRQGIVLEVDSSSAQMDRAVLELAFDAAGSAAHRLVNDPGWWAAHIAAAYVNFGLVVVVQRIVDRRERHIELLTEPGRLAALHPSWPMVRMSQLRPELDLRGEAALRLGPSDAELEEYARRVGAVGVSVVQLREMFDLGVIGFERGAVSAGRRRLVPAP